MKILLILSFAAIALMTSCEKQGTGNQDCEPDNAGDVNVMKFDVLHPATKATATAFEDGDRIGIYVTEYSGETASPLQISGNWANNVGATFGAGLWTTDKKIFWSDSKVDVYGYYPYMTPKSIDAHLFTIALDQSVPEQDGKLSGYEASDFLWAKATGAEQSEQSVALQFRHCMSKLVVELVKGSSYEGDFPENAEMYIHNVVPTATIDFTTGAVTKYLFGEPATVKARRIDDSRYEAIMVPQRLDSRRPFIELISNGVSYLLEDTFYFRPGKQHTISLVINSNPDQIEIEIGGSVEGGWN